MSDRPTLQRVRLLIVSTVVVGVLGLPFAMVFGEPYPWIMMPGFTGTGGFNGQVVERSTAAFSIHFENGETEAVDPSTLFGEVPTSSHYTLTALFAPAPGQGGKLEHLVKAFVPGLHQASRQTLDAGDPELRRWLRSQVHHLFPDRTPVAVDVEWQRVSIDTTGERHVIASEHTTRFEL